MKKFANLRKGLCMGIGFIAIGVLSAQNSVPFSSDFETGMESWTIENGTAANQWVRGNAATGNDGYCLYISNDNGITNAYDATAASVAHAFIYVNIPADGAVLKFRYRVAGDMTEGDEDEGEDDEYNDYLGVSVSGSAPVADRESVARWQYTDRSTWTEVSISLSGVSMTGNRYIIFSWVNDGNYGANPAAAIDDIKVMPLVQKPGTPTFSNVTASSMTVSWPASSTTGVKYRVQEAKGENGTNAPWVTVAEDLTETTLERTGLDENTNYYYRIQAYIDENTYSDYTGNYNGKKTLYACPAPTDLAYTVNNGDYVFTWQSEASSFRFEWKEASAENWTEIENVSAATYTLSGTSLQESTSYKVRVKAICNPTDLEDYTSELVFATPCPAQTIPYVENFDVWTDNRVNCWSITDANNDGKTWAASSTGDGVGATLCAKYPYSSGSKADDYLISPGILLSRAASVAFKLKTGSGEEKYSVLLSSTGTNSSDFTEVLIPETSIQNIEWQTITAELGKKEWVGKTVYIAIKACSEKNQYWLYVDDFSVVSCSAPALSASNLTTSSAQIDITSSASMFTVEYKLASAEQWTVLTNQTSPVQLTGLADGSEYVVRAKAHCSDNDESLYSDELTVYTAFATKPFPLYEDFAMVSVGKIPSGWDMRDSRNSKWEVKDKNGVKSLYYTGNNQQYSNISTPNIDLSTADRNRLELAFTYKVGNYSGNYFKVSYSTDNGINWTEMKTAESGSFSQTTQTSVVLPLTDKVGDAATIKVRFEATGSSNIYGDGHVLYDVKIRHTPICFPPIDVTVDADALTATSAKLFWKKPENCTPNAYKLKWQDVALQGEIDNKNTDNADTVTTINDLKQHTTYRVYVASECATESSEPVSVELTTPYSCPAVADLAVQSIDNESASFKFNAEKTGDIFEIEYKEVPAEGVGEWVSYNSAYEKGSFSLENLQPSTSYKVRVRAVCAVNDTSLWDSIAVKTFCEPALWPLAESFEGEFSDKAPACWSSATVSGTSARDPWIKSTDKAKTGASSLCYQSYWLQRGYVATMSTPILSFHPSATYTLSFWMYKEGTSDNAAELKIFVNDRVDTIGGTLIASIRNNKDVDDGSTSDGNGWNFYTFDISGRGGNAHIVFCGIADYTKSFYLDDVQVNPIYEFNIAVQAEPVLSRANLGEETVRVKLSNTGVSDWKGSVDLSFRVDDGETVTERVTIPEDDILLAEKASDYTYTFTAKADLSGVGAHTLIVMAEAENDPDEGDNTAVVRTTRYEALSVPYHTEFKTSENPYFHILDANNDGVKWTMGTDATPATLPASTERATDDDLYTPGLNLHEGIYMVGLTAAAVSADAEAKLLLSACTDYKGDSLPIMNLTLSTTDFSTQTAHIEITESDAYMFRLHGNSAKDGSDLQIRSLTVDMQCYFKRITAALCTGSSYPFGDRNLTVPGDYIDTVKVENAADTIIYLRLEEKPSYSFSLDTTICAGQTVVFGGKSYGTAGTYTETYVTEAGCDSVYILTLAVTPLLKAPVISRKDEGSAIILEAATEEARVQWYNTDGKIDGETALRYTVVTNGTYHATTSNRCGESEASNHITVTKLDNDCADKAVAPSVYPNPARTEVTIKVKDGGVLQSVCILSGNGRMVWSKDGLRDTELKVSVSGFEAGLYMVGVETTTGIHHYKLYIVH